MLSRANEILLMQDGTIVTAICGTIDLAKGVIRLANAGHPPALIRLVDGTIETIGATGPPLGALYQPAYAVLRRLYRRDRCSRFTPTDSSNTIAIGTRVNAACLTHCAQFLTMRAIRLTR